MFSQEFTKYLFPVVYLVFFVGFFFFSETKYHSNFYYAAFVLPFLIMILKKRVDIKAIMRSHIFLLSGFFMFYMCFTLLWGHDTDIGEIWKHTRRTLNILVFIAATMHLVHSDPKFLRRLLVLFCSLASVVSVVYSVYFYSHNPFPENRLFGYGLLFNPIGASSIYGIAFIACLSLFCQSQSAKERFICPLFLLSILFYIFLAQSRGPLMALVLTMTIWPILILFRRDGQRKYSKKISLIVLLTVTFFVSLFVLFPEFFQNLILNRGFSYRFEIWGYFIQKIKETPLFGYGLAADTQMIASDGQVFLHPHSVYIATLYYGGFIALGNLLLLVGFALVQGVSIKDRKISFLVTCSILFGALCFVTDGNTLIQHPKPFWIFFWFPIALAAASEMNGVFKNSQ